MIGTERGAQMENVVEGEIGFLGFLLFAENGGPRATGGTGTAKILKENKDPPGKKCNLLHICHLGRTMKQGDFANGGEPDNVPCGTEKGRDGAWQLSPLKPKRGNLPKRDRLGDHQDADVNFRCFRLQHHPGSEQIDPLVMGDRIKREKKP